MEMEKKFYPLSSFGVLFWLFFLLFVCALCELFALGVFLMLDLRVFFKCFLIDAVCDVSLVLYTLFT